MVHKKFIKRGKKVFGPYLYENYRVNGETKTRYLGLSNSATPNVRGNRKLLISAGFLFLILMGFAFYYFYFSGVTGKASLELSPSYSFGEQIKGNLNFALKQGELIPADSILKINLGSQERTITLAEILSNSNSGDFYAEGKQLAGSGEGYGTAGKKIIYPAVDFSLLISKNEIQNER